MKEIKAIIKPFVLERVIQALHGVKSLPAITISAAHGLSIERGTFDCTSANKVDILTSRVKRYSTSPQSIFKLPVEMEKGRDYSAIASLHFA